MTDLLLKDLCSKKPASSFCSMTQQVCDYVNQNINKPDLTLKFIAEQYLYMNTDYVSKKFQKDTGCKFSTYLTNIRIEKAKEFLLEDHTGKIQVVAEMVGCGNNPYYFSQLFKKKTGMTPSAYIAKIHGTSNISV